MLLKLTLFHTSLSPDPSIDTEYFESVAVSCLKKKEKKMSMGNVNNSVKRT